MIAATLTLIEKAIGPHVTELKGRFMLATDANEALFKAIRFLGGQWMCLVWISGGDGAGELERKGGTTAELKVAVVRRPRLTKDRADAALDDGDDLSLLNLWERVRGLFFRLRFGAALRLGEGTENEQIKFWAADGYLDGPQPMKMGKWSIERRTYEVAEAGGDPGAKAMKELLWAETAWTLELALPAVPVDEPHLNHFWISTHQAPAGVQMPS